MTTEQEIKNYVNKFWMTLVKYPEKAIYGTELVVREILRDNVDVLLLSNIEKNRSFAQSFNDELKRQNTTILFVNFGFREGMQLLDFGGIAAILR